jgi:hypothetical protein
MTKLSIGGRSSGKDRRSDEVKRAMAMRTRFISRALIAGVAALAMMMTSAGSATSGPKDDPVAWIVQYENDAAAADLAGDVSFYQKNLADDWSDGMSNGQFQTKKELISDLSDKAHNITFHETLANMKVRVYGDAAVATYTETYDALSSGKGVAKTIITTDTFVKVGGQWKLASAHSSTVVHP